MLRSLFAGISGLRVNQTMLDVTGNNIANANTVGFKSSRTIFQDTLSQMLTSAASPNAAGTRGGTNPIQVGLGVSVAATSTNFTQGSNQTTGQVTDLMIQGDGMFVVRKNGDDMYTRAGAFAWDEDANLVTPGGGLVQGYTFNSAGVRNAGLSNLSLDPDKVAAQLGLDPATTKMKSYEIGADGTITGTFYDSTTQDSTDRKIGQIALANFPNPMGLAKVGETSFRATANSGRVDVGVPGEGANGVLVGGAVEMSNVDLAAEFTNLILAQRGFQASSRVITTSDQVLEELVNIKR